MSHQKLFSDFPPIAKQEWENKITEDLKGASYDKLLWKTLEGITLRPYYRKEDVTENEFEDLIPGQFPYVRGTKSTNDWWVRQDINVDELGIEKSNEKALEILMKGVNSINFIMLKKYPENVFKNLFKDIAIEAIQMNFTAGENTHLLLQSLKREIEDRQLSKESLQISYAWDILSQAAQSGKWMYDSEAFAWAVVSEYATFCTEFMPFVRYIQVDASVYHHAGATIVQELAFAVASGNEYLAKLTEKNKVDEVASYIWFQLATGSNYFMEIAKLRAARLLWAKIVEQYKPNNIEKTQMYIHSVTSEWNQTAYDLYVNMLRNTTESMSAAIGGCDSMTVTTFDKLLNRNDETSERLSRNVQIILKEESYLDKTTDASAGSYYIEHLTKTIAEEAWKLFLQIEEKGGFTNALKEGFVQTEIEKSAATRNALIASKREIILGTNQYANPKDKVAKLLPTETKTESKGTDIKPLTLYRAAQEFENLRIRTEKSGKTPKVFLLTIGNLAMRKARASFSSNFFATAGYEVIDNNGFNTAKEGIQAALDSKAEITVVCSSDEEYATIVPEVLAAMKGKTITVVAGYPKDLIDTFTKAGLDCFIHIKSNLLETLQQFHKLLGIK